MSLLQGSAIAANGVDTARVHTPLPGGVGAVVRAMFNAPAWLQITVLAAGGVTVAALLGWLWLRRARWLPWLVSRSRGWKIAFAGIAVLVLTGAASFGMVSWKYTQHDNDFCIGCHVMNPAWTKFQQSEHRKLLCHDCHQQSIVASMRQLYLWVAERPAEIPPHAKVPTATCKTCHDQAKPDSTWKRIIATAGHRVHLRNADPKLAKVECVTCHGAEVHHFVPIDKTCGQAECHHNIVIKLGKMAGQTSLHCTGCHNFTEPVGTELAVSPDSARVHLVPSGAKCLDCHQMRERLETTLAQFDPAKEPHRGVCGACHDPHKQTTPQQAFESCAKAGCHARPDTLTPFHRGLHKGALENCASCHKAHTWKVETTNCQACHGDIGGSTPRRIRMVTTKRVHGPSPSVDEPPETRPDTTFKHATHKALTCTSCHSAERSHGEITIKRPDGCLGCHHAATQTAACADCHPSSSRVDRPQTIRVTTTVARTPRTRTLPFAHDRHTKLDCKTCHTTSLTLAAATTCTSCHADHHVATADCQSCHPAAPIRAQVAAHPRDLTHGGCTGSGCHLDAAVAMLAPTRNVCIACHRDQANHKPGGECATCHLVAWRQPESQGGAR